MMKSSLFMLLLMFTSLGACAICPEKKVSLCGMVSDSKWVIWGEIEAKKNVSNEDDPQGVAGWLYHVKVKNSYRNPTQKNMVIYSENTTSRVVLDKSKSYFIFASRNFEGLPETANFCDPYTESAYSKDLESKILVCIKK